jgi:ADP-ribose pyrophosphatase YjhB (NUDIX family)
LVERDGGLLLARRASTMDAFPNTWGLPSVPCESDEPPELSVAREACTKTGLLVHVGQLVDGYFFDDDSLGSGLLLVYEAQTVGGELKGEDEEISNVGFFTPGDLPQPLCGGGHDQAIGAWQARVADPWQPGSPVRFCPHCAHPLEERLAFGRLRPGCPRCGFVHFIAPKVGVSILVEREGQMLLVKRAVDPGRGQWCLPSGFIEWDESPQAAAARECLEETGLAIENLELLEATHYTDDFRGAGINLTFRGEVNGGSLRAGDDAAVARFFRPEELPPLEAIAFRNHRLTLERWLVARSLKREPPTTRNAIS